MQMLKISEVVNLTKLSKPSVYRLIRENRFPKQVKLGERSSAWVEEEIQEWIEARIEASRKEVA